jgi:uncharacterized protein YqjF (DUF2071 family)
VNVAFLETAARQAAVADDTGHRPWPLPETPWAAAHTWEDVAFLNWRVDADELAKLVGRSVELDTFEGEAWLGITPFLLTGLRPRGLPSFGRLSTFPQLNVRTYVTRDGKPGLWFFSLDAGSTLAVEGAKRLYRLPYSRAQMTHERKGELVRFESARPGAAFSGSYRAAGDRFRPEPGTLEHFLTERYCLYTEDGSRAFRIDVHHPPWRLRPAEATVDLNTIAPVELGDEPPHVLVSPRQDGLVWPPAELSA